MAWAWLSITQYATAILMLLLAAWMCWLNFASRAVRAFAAFLVLGAAATLAIRFAALDEGRSAAFERVHDPYSFWALLALAYFISIYPRPRGPLAQRWGLVLLVGAGVAFELAFALDPCLVRCDSVGPLGLLASAFDPAYTLTALVLAREAAREPSEHRRTSHSLMATGFLLGGVVDGGVFLGALVVEPRFLLGGVPGGSPVEFAIPIVALVPAMGALLILARSRVAGARRIAAWTALAVATGFAAGSFARDTDGVILVIGVWRAALPVLVALALVRYRIFDLDAKATWTLSRGTVGALFLVVFIVVSDLAENFVSERVSAYFGVVAAVLLVVALAPLQHMAERLVASAFGKPRPIRVVPLEDRLHVYRQQAERAWRHGPPSASDRGVLEQLAHHLEIPEDEAARIEAQIVARSSSVSPQESPA